MDCPGSGCTVELGKIRCHGDAGLQQQGGLTGD